MLRWLYRSSVEIGLYFVADRNGSGWFLNRDKKSCATVSDLHGSAGENLNSYGLPGNLECIVLKSVKNIRAFGDRILFNPMKNTKIESASYQNILRTCSVFPMFLQLVVI